MRIRLRGDLRLTSGDGPGGVVEPFATHHRERPLERCSSAVTSCSGPGVTAAYVCCFLLEPRESPTARTRHRRVGDSARRRDAPAFGDSSDQDAVARSGCQAAANSGFPSMSCGTGAPISDKIVGAKSSACARGRVAPVAMPFPLAIRKPRST